MKFYILVIAILLLLSACSGGAKTPEPVSTAIVPTFTATNTPNAPPPAAATGPLNTATAPPVEPPRAGPGEATPTPEATTPGVAGAVQTATPQLPPNTPQPETAQPTADCVDQAAFIGDASVPDGTLFRQGETFAKAWRIRNTGSCPWDAKYAVIHSGGDIMSGNFSNPLPDVAPGEIADVSVDLTAPNRGGTYTGYWSFRNPSGKTFGVGFPSGPLWVQISVAFVPSGAASTASAGGAVSTPSQGACAYQPNDAYVSELLNLINQARTSNGLNPVTLQDQLSAAALAHSLDMACNRFVDHPGSDGSTWYQRVGAQGYSNPASSRENIYVGDPAFGGDPQGALDWWLGSQIHRDTLLSATATEIGIGYIYLSGSQYGGYYTVILAHPAP